MGFGRDNKSVNGGTPLANNKVDPMGLSDFDESFEKSEARQTGFRPLPDGDYVCRLHTFKLQKTKTKGEPMLVFWFEVLEPIEFKGKFLFKNIVVRKDSMEFLKGDLLTLGFEGKLSELPDQMPDFLDMVLAIYKQTKEYPNKETGEMMSRESIYINEVLFNKLEDYYQDRGMNPEEKEYKKFTGDW